MVVGRKIHIKGIVQGVGFRPFVYGTAEKFGISGWVKNSSAGVEILAAGPDFSVRSFIDALKLNPPTLSNIDSFAVTEIDPGDVSTFEILESESIDGDFIPVSSDMSICDECLAELFNPADRRYRYQFINCTNCGPRFTIIKDIPYDRPLTTMAGFSLCTDCLAEYQNPHNRRFHAQPVACESCGPNIWFDDQNGNCLQGEQGLQMARSYLKQGKIVAIKGLGGFHLACDASNLQTVDNLRARKKRSDKPFAIMVFNTDTAKLECEINTSEQALLESREKPVVILGRNSTSTLPQSIAPGVSTLGIMLPYTPLHYLLLEPEQGFPRFMVMTSGNISEEPIAYANQSAKICLALVADGFLLHNRNIETRVDDSVLTVVESKPYFFRRSRGFAPAPITISKELSPVLAVGAELKNTFCLTRDHYAFISHHIGDLQNLETLNALEEGIPHFEKLFKIKPIAIACDMHPDYLSTRYAEKRACTDNVPLLPIQHHHAHLAAALADNNWASDEAVIGVCFDGTGYGLDGNIWGGEFFYGGYTHFERKYHLAYMPLPGGDSSTLHPAKIAAAYLWQLSIDWSESLPSIQALTNEEKSVLRTQLQNDLNCPKTSSMGRLFDAVASLAGVRQIVNYEAQAAIELENYINPTQEDAYHFEIDESLIHLQPLINEILIDIDKNVHASDVAAKFHNAIRKMVVESCIRISKEVGCKTVALSGGVWQNINLLTRTMCDLKNEGFTPLIHRQVPTNDGGLALGQALIANFQINRK